MLFEKMQYAHKNKDQWDNIFPSKYIELAIQLLGVFRSIIFICYYLTAHICSLPILQSFQNYQKGMRRQEKKSMIPQPDLSNRLNTVLQNSPLIKNKDFTFEQEKPFSTLNCNYQHTDKEQLQRDRALLLKQMDTRQLLRAQNLRNIQMLGNAQPRKIHSVENKPLYNLQAKQNPNNQINFFTPPFFPFFTMQHYLNQRSAQNRFNEQINNFFSQPASLPLQSLYQVININDSNKNIEINKKQTKKEREIKETIEGEIVQVICIDADEESYDAEKHYQGQKTSATKVKKLNIETREDDAFIIIKAKKAKKYDYTKVYGMSRYKYMKMLREQEQQKKRHEKSALPSISEEGQVKDYNSSKIQRNKKIKKQQKKKKQVDKNQWFPKYPIKIDPRNQMSEESQSQMINATIPQLMKQTIFFDRQRRINEKRISLLSRQFVQSQNRKFCYQKED